MLVDKARELPQGESRDEGKQQNHGIATQADAGNHNGNEEDAGDGADDEVLHKVQSACGAVQCRYATFKD